MERSPEPVGKLGNEIRSERNPQPLPLHLDRSHDVLVLGFRREEEALAEDVEPPVAPDEADEVVRASVGIVAGSLPLR